MAPCGVDNNANDVVVISHAHMSYVSVSIDFQVFHATGGFHS
jgi:hypothetical protein